MLYVCHVDVINTVFSTLATLQCGHFCDLHVPTYLCACLRSCMQDCVRGMCLPENLQQDCMRGSAGKHTFLHIFVLVQVCVLQLVDGHSAC